jgi:hypothetical protein
MGFFNNFNTLAMAFLAHYQLLIRYERGTKKLISFKQSSSTQISYHIHEWRMRRRLIKVTLPDQLLVEWFTKSLISPIAHYVSMGSVVTEEYTIIRAQYLDLVYSQMNTLYDLIPDVPHSSTNPTPTLPVASHVADGLIGTFHDKTQSKQVNHSNPKPTTTSVQNVTPPSPSPSKTSEVNMIQSTTTSKYQKNKKGKGKNKEDKTNNQQPNKQKTQSIYDKEN